MSDRKVGQDAPQPTSNRKSILARLMKAHPAGPGHASEDDCPVCALIVQLELEEMEASSPVETSALQTERDTYCLVLGTLVRKLEAIHEDPRYKAVWQSFMLHGGQYTEPTYTEELEAAQKILRHFSESGAPQGEAGDRAGPLVSPAAGLGSLPPGSSSVKASGPRLGDPHPPSCACWECCK